MKTGRMEEWSMGEWITHRAVRLIFHQSNLWRVGAPPPDGVPVTHVDPGVYGNPHVVRDIVFSHVDNVIQLAPRLNVPGGVPTPATTITTSLWSNSTATVTC